MEYGFDRSGPLPPEFVAAQESFQPHEVRDQYRVTRAAMNVEPPARYVIFSYPLNAAGEQMMPRAVYPAQTTHATVDSVLTEPPTAEMVRRFHYECNAKGVA